MRIIKKGPEHTFALGHLTRAEGVALQSTCLRAKGGSIIVKDLEVIGEGFNSPPGDLESQRRCLLSKKDLHEKVTDSTCCIHAERRAIQDALKRNSEKLKGSRIYFVRLGRDNKMTRVGDPYCTICSKDALDNGIAEFVLLHEQGICVYDTEEYNQLSFAYGKK